ncbi:hypothetical protein M2271_007251 [Streptomyces sp. LBL]|uniref:hypothetical protein n=1 Tax=Streptomyces sp. LBL TaxID=2940562 RepID=UPI0024736AB6|nr:hypothetical protein [Streptomyces sp. LBL]MDH6629415.1 hypothetical protein [Streptomyces sp. LBL]
MRENEWDGLDEWGRLAATLKFIKGYAAWDVEQLVRLIGSQKAGARVIERIEEKLAEKNIGHLPTRLPTDSTRRVLLYSKEHVGLGYILSLVHQLATQEPADGENATVYQLESLLNGISALTRVTGRTDGRSSNVDHALEREE